ncbi:MULTISPECIES: GntR family transcriptional regulator [Anaerotruncus]|uniref:GntR family transcriptional regulator n=1 Tax=Anaerotruncus TaxID=244127 RepID=UPI00083368F0|nr:MULTISPECIES: GntR family transcriptional regulator [Anaerotruncus]
MNLTVYPSLPSEPAGEYVYRVLRKNILAGNLLPGECLGPTEIGKLLQVSRTPLQSASVRLMTEGLLKIYPQRGSYVSRIDMKRVYEATCMRNLLEQAAMRVLCTEGIGREGLMQLQANLIQQNFSFEQKQTCDVFELDNAFHELLFSLAGMSLANEALQSISADQYRVRLLKLQARFRWEQTVAEHTGIIAAIQARDVEAGLLRSNEHLSRISWDLETIHEQHPDYFENWESFPPRAFCKRRESFYTIYRNSDDNAALED